MPSRVPRSAPYALLAASVVLTGMAGLAPRPGRPVAAIFPPWWSAARAFSAAADSGADIVRIGAVSTVVVLVPDRSRPDLRPRLRQAGALLVLDAQAFGGCAGALSNGTVS